MIGFAPQTEQLLAFSAEQYRELLQHAEKLSAMLNNCDYSRVHEHAGRLQELQSAASQQDEQLLPLLQLDLPAWEGHPLYRTRLRFINAILELNSLLVPKIRAMKASFAADLKQLKEGRTAISGYQPSARRPHGISRGIG